MSLVIKFYFNFFMLSVFRTLIHPSILSPYWSCVLVSICDGVSVSPLMMDVLMSETC